MKNLNKIKNLFLTGSIVVMITSCGKSNQSGQANAPVAVNIDSVKNEKVVYYQKYPGNIIALNQVELRGEVSGYLTGLYVNDGQQVHKGQKLYEIEQSRYRAALDQATANVQIASDNLEKAQQDADRYSKLGEQDAVARQRVDYALTDLQNAKSQLISAKADLQKAQLDFKNSIITAPFDGTIGISQVKLGTLVTPGQTLLNIISSNSPMAVDFIINENEIRRYHDLVLKKITEEDSTFRIVLPDNSTYPYNGTISFIDRAVDPQTGTIKIRLIFPNQDLILRPGMNCSINVLNENAGIKSVIPYKAVMEQMSEYFVFEVKKDKVRQIKIQLGTRVGDKAVVNSGLSKGDTIVTDGIQKLHDGSLIQMEKTKATKKMITSI